MHAWLSEQRTDIVASWLMHTELHCAASRRPDVVALALLGELLDRTVLVDVTRTGLLMAPSVGRALRTLDAVPQRQAIRTSSPPRPRPPVRG